MRDVNGTLLQEGQKVRILAPGQFGATVTSGTIEVGGLGIVSFVDCDKERGVDVDHIDGTLTGFDFFRGRDLEVIDE